MNEEKWLALEELYDALDKVVRVCHVRYDYEDDSYHADFNADSECVASIENAYVDLKFFLGKA